MKYRILLMGNNKSTIDDIFGYLSENFECQNTSSRFDDIVSHLKYFQPHVFMYCMNNEARDTMTQLITIKREKAHPATFFVVIGAPEDCEELHRLSADAADLELLKPITAAQIAETVMRSLRNASVEADDYKTAVTDPLTAKPVRPAPAAPAAPKPSSGLLEVDELFGSSGESGRRHVLVVDDDPRMLRLIKRYLEDSFDIATAVNGKVALKFLETKRTDLILLDYEMPAQNGQAVLEKLREDPMTSDIPVIFLTGINDRKKIQQVLALQPQGYLLKPIDYKRLVRTIEEVIG